LLDRYKKNITTLSIDENEKLKDYSVCVVGAGGLGGYVVEMLGRLGIGHIIVVDYDVFDESNLNRQILSDNKSLGFKKAIKAKERMTDVNPLVKVDAIVEKFTNLNGREILKDVNIVVDALDNMETRLSLEKICEELNIPMVHGSIAGWYGQVTTVLPGDKTLSRFYAGKPLKGIEEKLGNPSFTPALVASIQVSEILKLLIGRGEILSKKMLFIDTLMQDYEVVKLFD
jgi:molybdopterin/thiamine biosynthesis adenylyltransferase